MVYWISVEILEQASRMLRLIAAIDEANGVADERGIPWQGKLPADTEYYRKQTSTGIIVMGYGTYKEFDAPLHNRENFVVTHSDTGELRPGFTGIADTESFLHQHSNELVWVIGGAALFAKTITKANELYITQLHDDFHCTKFFPRFSDAFHLQSDSGPHVENGITFHFEIWQRSPLSPQ